MFELKITNLREAVTLSQQWATHTISLLDPDIDAHLLKIPEATASSQLKRCYFHDLTPDSAMLKYLNNPILASKKQLEEVLAFSESVELKDKLLVHCHAGISRSTAVAIGILYQHGLNPREATQQVLTIRPQAFPNHYILELFDDIFALKGEFVTITTEELRKFDKKLFE